MRQHIPFPSTIIAMSAARARVEQADDRPKPRVGDVRVIENAPAYRLPNGRIQLCYDPYTPTYLAEAEPGLATQRGVLKYYPNDTTGYEYSASDFITLEQAKENGMIIDDLAAIHFSFEETGAFGLIIGPRASANSQELKVLAELADVASSKEPVIFRLGEPEDELEVFCAFSSGFVRETWAAPTEEMLAIALHTRFEHSMEGVEPKDYEAVAAKIRESCGKYGHNVVIGHRADLEADFEEMLRAAQEARHGVALSI